MYGPVILPEHMNNSPHWWLKQLIKTGKSPHNKIPNDSISMSHLEDLSALFLASYEKKFASGRYYGVQSSWHWKDIYLELKKILPYMKMPEDFNEKAVSATGFDFTRRDSLGVNFRDIPTMLYQTIEWIKTNPFG